VVISDYNTPVMYTDISGYAWWNPFSWSQETKLKVMSGCMAAAGVLFMMLPGTQVLGAALIGAGVGSYIGGNISSKNGGNYLAGWTGGLITGAILGAASPIAGQLYGIAFSTSLGAGTAFVDAIMFTATVGAIGGAVGTLVKQSITGVFNGSELINNTLMTSGLFTVFGPLTFVSYGIGAAGYLGLGAGVGLLTEVAYDLTNFLIDCIRDGGEYCELT